MASVKVCFAVGLLMTAFSTAVLGIQDIPDDVVYTDVTKTLIRNNTGVLTCLFKGTPQAVYWRKGLDPLNATLLVRLYYGEKGGPRYEDGSCDIDENYSLIIKRVRTEDAGLYTCRVVSYKGILIQNFTGVTTSDAAVKTRSVVALQKGRPGVLPCEPIIRPKKISWLRRPNERLVTMELSGNARDRSGPGYDEGLYNISNEYSLVIKDVMVMHEDRYVCEVTDYDTDSLFQNGTLLNVFDFPLEPFPSIEECPQEQQNLPSCTLRITSRTSLTCQVEGYYPHIDLFFVHGLERVDSLETRVWKNSDGTKSKRVTISSDASSDTEFECVAAGLVGQADTRSKTVRLILDDLQSHVAVAVAVPVTVILVSAIIVIVILVFKKRKTHFKRDYNEVPMVHKVMREGKAEPRGKADDILPGHTIPETEPPCADGGFSTRHLSNVFSGQEKQPQVESAQKKLKVNITALGNEKDKCEGEVQNMKLKVNELKLEPIYLIDKHRERLAKIENDVTEAKKRFEETKRENQEQIEDLKREVSQKRQDCVSLDREYVNLKRRMRESEIKYENEREKFTRDRDHQEKEHIKRMEEMGRLQTDLRKKLDELRTYHEALKNEKVTTEREVEKQKSENEKLKDEYQSLLDRYRALDKLSVEKRAHLDEVDRKIEIQNKALIELKRRTEDLGTECHSTKDELSAFEIQPRNRYGRRDLQKKIYENEMLYSRKNQATLYPVQERQPQVFPNLKSRLLDGASTPDGPSKRQAQSERAKIYTVEYQRCGQSVARSPRGFLEGLTEHY